MAQVRKCRLAGGGRTLFFLLSPQKLWVADPSRTLRRVGTPAACAMSMQGTPHGQRHHAHRRFILGPKGWGHPAESIYAFVRNPPATFFVYSRRRRLPCQRHNVHEADSPSFLPSSIS